MIRLGRKRQRRSFPGIAYLDLLVNLLMVFVVLVALLVTLVKPTVGKPTIETLGTVAVVATWPESKMSDVDLWMQNPEGAIAYFANLSVGSMYLEHDDLAYKKVKGQKIHYERMIIQSAINGEYTVNIMLYRKDTNSTGPIPVTITLWRLRGNDRVITVIHLTLDRRGQERTAFRFTLNDAGEISHVNHLQKKLLGKEYVNVKPNATAPFPPPPGAN